MSIATADALMGVFGYKRARTKKCKICREPFVPRSMTHKTCSPDCAQIHVQAEKIKAMKRADREKAKAFKTRAEWQKDAQAAFNAYIRARDADLPCISCGRYHTGQWHAGHYLSVGARPNLRFNEKNLHKQCQPCNTHLHGNLINYRINLVARIGVTAVEALEADHAPRKYSIPELQDITKHYKAKAKALITGGGN